MAAGQPERGRPASKHVDAGGETARSFRAVSPLMVTMRASRALLLDERGGERAVGQPTRGRPALTCA